MRLGGGPCEVDLRGDVVAVATAYLADDDGIIHASEKEMTDGLEYSFHFYIDNRYSGYSIYG